MIALDKQAHFLAGAAITLALGYFIPALAALGMGIASGAIKELYDLFHKDNHTPDPMDFVVTALGGFAGYFCVALSAQTITML